jgi:hypothetical protein
MHLSRVPALLNSFDKKTKTSLVITRKGGVTRRQVERLYNVIAAAFDSDGVESFDEFCDTLLVATLDKSSADTNSVAIDGTSIDSWGTRRRVYHSNGAMTFNSTDPDAAWRAKSKDNPWKRPVFGYDLTVAVTVPEINGPAVALGARSMRFRAANQHVMASARAVVKEVARQQGVLGDVLMDREYTMKNDGSDLILPIRALGGEPIFQLTKKSEWCRWCNTRRSHHWRPTILAVMPAGIAQPGRTCRECSVRCYCAVQSRHCGAF